MAKTTKKTTQSGEEVAVSTLDALQEFNHKGHKYTFRRPTAAGMKCLSTDGKKLLYLPADTMVTPL